MNNLKASLNFQINFICVVNRLKPYVYDLNAVEVNFHNFVNSIPFQDINKLHQSYIVHFNYAIQPMGC